ncbi:unnamed protein product [Medioppia subpectinata]|uniref:HBS1-like protein n=1 Tax=Medioppia subpectinata TaxID=1979941 RepID=A0A7R9L4N1_9ACAR|nr:unnamed protein product [Medioppia subpectinata]CAG2115496.1 unnamed protein product [Medioppia subpectinata]
MYNRSQSSSQRQNSDPSVDLMNTSTAEEDDDEEDLDFYKNGSDMDQLERAKLISCVEEMENVVGETIPQSLLIRAAKIHNYDIKLALDSVLNVHTNSLQSQTNGAINSAINTGKRLESVSERQSMNSVANNSDFKQIYSTEKSKSSSPLFVKIRDSCDAEVAKINKTLGQLTVNKSEPNLKALSSPVRKDLDKSRLDSNYHQYSSPNSPISSRTGSRMSSPNHERASESKASKPLQTKALTPEVALSEYNKNRNTGKPNINMVVIGHVDAGKSTLMGHLLYRLGFVSQKAIHRYETDSKKMGKNSFLYAWVLDETQEERSRGITMDIAESRFETKERARPVCVELHKDYKDLGRFMIRTSGVTIAAGVITKIL